MDRVVIVGVGFGGLQAARDLAGRGAELVLVNRNNFHTFTPLLYQVATGSQEQESIVYPLRDIIRDWPDTKFRLAEVQRVDLEHQLLETDHGPIAYDYLILAPGSVPAYFGMESIRRWAYPLKDLGEAVQLRNRILSAFEQALDEPDHDVRRALLTFVIVGGGPTGIEFAGALAELVHLELRRDYAELAREEVRVILLEASSRLLGVFPAPLGEYAVARLERMGVEVRLGSKVIGAERDKVLLAEADPIPTFTLFWSTGVEGEPLDFEPEILRVHGGRLAVEPDLSLPGHPEVFAIGDLAYVEQDGAALPQMAPVAIQEGAHAARSVLARLRGQAAKPFHFRDKGMMAVIGRGKAVATLFGLNFRGFLAWLVWLGFHLISLIGFRNRVVVLVNWVTDYFLFARKIRLITQQDHSSVSDPSLQQRQPS